MKKVISVLLSIVLFTLSFSPCNCTAATAKEFKTADGLYRYQYYDNTESSITINYYYGDEEIVYVPSEIDGKPVVSTNYQCFYMNQYIKEIHFPASLINFHVETFYACIACEKYYVDENNPVYCSIDGIIYDKTGTKLCFCPENYQTETFVVKDDVVEIGTNAFRYHQIYYPEQIFTSPMIKHIVFPEGLKRIMNGAFSGSNIQEFILPDSLTDEGGNFLSGASNYKKLHIGANMGTKYTSGFNCYYLNEISVSPENKSFIAENNVLYNKDKTILYCFPSGREEQTYRIPDSVKTLASYSFNASKLKNIDFNEVEVIESQTFGQDLTIKNLVFPKSLKRANTIANFFQPGIKSITILNPECEFSFPFGFGSGIVNYTVTIYGFSGSTAEAYVKNNTLSNLNITFSALHTSDTEYNIYSGVHDYQGIVTEPTCTEQGYTHYTCSVCGIEYNDNYTDALGHNFLPYAIIAPTCEEQGYTIYKCSRCEKTIHSDYTQPIGHNLAVTKKVEATCTDNGYVKYKCLQCQMEKTEIIEATSHRYSVKNKTEPDCTSSGFTTYECSECGNTYVTDYIEPLGHNYYTTVTPSTFINNGAESVRCSRCKTVKSVKAIPQINQVKLKMNSFTYSGKSNGLSLIVNDINGNSIPSSEYNIVIYSRSNGKKVLTPAKIGQYKAFVYFKSHYSGSICLYFYIKPKTPTVNKLTSLKRQIKVAVKKDTSVNGHQIVISENKKFTKNVKTYNLKSLKSSKKIKGLKRRKKYYIKIRSYKIVKVDGKSTKMFSEYTEPKMIKTK